MAPEPELDARFSSPGATALPWAEAETAIARAEIFRIATVRADGRPHVTPLIAVWHGGVAYFCTGAGEQKARNLAQNPACVLTCGSGDMSEGLDIVIEGTAERASDEPLLREIAGAYTAKYGSDWRFDVRDGTFAGPAGNRALVFALAPSKILAFRQGAEFSQTRWRP